MANEARILDEQGILLFNLERLVRGRAEKGIANTNKNTTNFSVSEKRYQETNTGETDELMPCVCLADSNDPSSFMTLFKSRTKNNKVISDMLTRMSTFELSSLVPTIRLFKIFYTSDGKKVPIEIPFDTTAKGIEDVFKSGTGRGTGAGITGIEWKHNPKNEASAPTYNVNLRLHLQNVEEFFKVRNSIMIDGNYLATVQIQDLLYQTQSRREGSSIYNPKYYEIKLMVGWTIGQGGIDSIRMNTSRKDVETFIQALKEQTEIMYLKFVFHDMQFNEDGSLDIQINYYGSADVDILDIAKSNVLVVDKDFGKEIEKIKQEIESAKEKEAKTTKEVSTASREPSDTFNPGGLAGISLTTAELEQLTATATGEDTGTDSTSSVLEKKLENIKKGARRRKYIRLVKRMLEKQHIHFFLYDVEAIKQYSNLKANFKIDGAEVKNIYEFNKNVLALKRKAVPASDAAIDQATLKRTGQTDIDSREAATEALQTDATQKLDNEGAAKANKPPDTSATSQQVMDAAEDFADIIKEGEFNDDIPYLENMGQAQFGFFYLSSLIDALLEPLFDQNANNPNFINKTTRVILGPISITDYGTLYDSGVVREIFPSVESISSDGKQKSKYAKVFRGKEIITNIGDIPISLKEFTGWFNRTIIDRNLDEMTLNDFITSLCQELITDCLNNDVYSFAIPQKTHVVLESFTSIAGVQNEALFYNNMTNYRWTSKSNNYRIKPYAGGFRLDASAMQSLRTKFEDMEKDNDPDSENYIAPKNYIILYSSSETPETRIADSRRDSEEGIFHFYYGDSKSIIRTMKFSRIDNPHARANSIVNSNVTDRQNSKIVREKYDVNLEIFGNTEIQAGTVIFISPTYPGKGKGAITQKLLTDIGLGGYYFVTEVHNIIEPGDFVTKIKAKWVSSADGRTEMDHIYNTGKETLKDMAAEAEGAVLE